MDGQEIIIQFDGHQVYLSDTHVIPIDNVGLSEYAKEKGLIVSTWTLYIRKYIPAEKRIFTDILSTNLGEEDFPVSQIANPEIPKIEKIDFKNVDTNLFLQF